MRMVSPERAIRTMDSGSDDAGGRVGGRGVRFTLYRARSDLSKPEQATVQCVRDRRADENNDRLSMGRFPGLNWRGMGLMKGGLHGAGLVYRVGIAGQGRLNRIRMEG